MSLKTQKPYDWVKQVEPELLNLDTSPLVGASPPFPWEQLSERLAKCFELTSLSIRPEEPRWRSAQELFEGMGNHLIPLHIAIPSLSGSLCWVMTEEEINLLMALLLTKDSHLLSFQDSELRESFTRFVYLETLFQLSQVDFDKKLAPTLNHKTDLPNQDSLCLDISINLSNQVLWGRLIISPEFRQAWCEKYSRQSPTPRAKEIAQQADVILHLEIGRTLTNLTEWSTLKPGDFILLDRCHWDSNESTGRVILTSNGRPVFAGDLENGQIKIIEFSQYYEAEVPMESKSEDKNSKENNKKDDDEETNDELSEFESSDDDFLFDDEDSFAEESEVEQEHSSTGSIVEEDEETTEKGATQIEGEEEEEEELTEQHIEVTPAEEVKTQLAPREIPLNVIVEIGRIQMNVQKLLELEPGNLLELNVHPESGVDLVINSKKVGKGELIRIGENLGVRILEIGT